MLNKESYKKWLADKKVLSILKEFHKQYLVFIRHSFKKALSRILKLIEFKTYLKLVFVKDNTSLVSLQSDLDFEVFCRRVFSQSIYKAFLSERFTFQQIQQYRNFLKVSKMSKKPADWEQVQADLINLRVPSYSEFVKGILLVDIQMVTEKMQEQLLKKEIEQIQLRGQEIVKQKEKIENMEINLIKKLDQKRYFGFNELPKPKFFAHNQLLCFKGIGNLNISDQLQKVAPSCLINT